MKKWFVIILLTLMLLSLVVSKDVSREDAQAAIDEARVAIDYVFEHGYSTVYLSDQLSAAERVMSALYYVDILESPSTSSLEKSEASAALRLVDYSNLSYSNVIFYTDEVLAASEKVFEVSDMLKLLESHIIEFEQSGGDSSEIRSVYRDAVILFESERYDDSNEKAEEAYQLLEEGVSGLATAATLFVSVESYFVRNWIYFVEVIVVVGGLVYLFYPKIISYFISRKIGRLKNESKALKQLIIEIQNSRYKEGDISEVVYKVRYEKYKQKISDVDNEIKVLKSRLRHSKGK